MRTTTTTARMPGLMLMVKLMMMVMIMMMDIYRWYR